MASQNHHEFLSPMRKLVTFFHDSRDRPKAKHHDLKKIVKALQNQTRAVERRPTGFGVPAQNRPSERRRNSNRKSPN